MTPPHGAPAPDEHAEVGASYTGEWALFRDYCAATGQPALPTTPTVVAGFLAAVSGRPSTQRRRLAAIAAAHHRGGLSSGHLWSAPSGYPRETPRRDAGDLIGACPIRGWPSGFAGRRDGFLVVLIEVLGLSYARARRLTPTQIGTAGEGLEVAGVRVPTGEDPHVCPACAVARWLDVRDLAFPIGDGLGRAIAAEVLTAAALPGPDGPHHHLPRHDRWRQTSWLVIGVDQHGWLRDPGPLSARSISTRMHAIRAAARR